LLQVGGTAARLAGAIFPGTTHVHAAVDPPGSDALVFFPPAPGRAQTPGPRTRSTAVPHARFLLASALSHLAAAQALPLAQRLLEAAGEEEVQHDSEFPVLGPASAPDLVAPVLALLLQPIVSAPSPVPKARIGPYLALVCALLPLNVALLEAARRPRSLLHAATMLRPQTLRHATR